MGLYYFLAGCLTGSIIILIGALISLWYTRKKFVSTALAVLRTVPTNTYWGFCIRTFCDKPRSYKEMKQLISELQSADRDSKGSLRIVLGSYYDYFMRIKL